MPCYKPIHGWRAKRLSENGKRPVVFNPKYGFLDMPVTVPCGRCIGCRLDKSNEWAARCMHEASLYKDNCFITLTFKDSRLPENNSLDLEIFQKFMKRLRKKCSGTTEVWNEKKKIWEFPIRFFHCGEYGKKHRRPHYHACIFNYDFPDKYHWSTSKNGDKYYRSKILEDLWQDQGFCIIGELTYESAGYTARYITKKFSGDDSDLHYCDQDILYNTGEITNEVKPEYATMSRNPGIGKKWYDQFKDDVFPNDYIIVKKRKQKPPKFYEKIFEQEHPMDYAILKNKRKEKAELSEHNTPERLQKREEIHERKARKLKRGYEDD